MLGGLSAHKGAGGAPLRAGGARSALVRRGGFARARVKLLAESFAVVWYFEHVNATECISTLMENCECDQYDRENKSTPVTNFPARA